MSHFRIEEMLSESGLDPELMGDVVVALTPLAEVGDVPVPSAELAKLFGAGHPGRSVPALLGRRRAVAGVLVLALSGVSATGLSAAANTLPRPLQHGVSQFSRHYLPFDLPEPGPRPKEPRSFLGAPAPAGPTPLGERADDPASRSILGRDHDPAAAYADHAGEDPPSPAAQPYASPSAAPSYSAEGFAGPSPSAQPSVSGSPTPSDDSAHGSSVRPTSTPASHPTDKGDKGSGKDKGGKDPDQGAPGKGDSGKDDSGKDKGSHGPDKGSKPGGGDDHGPGHGSDPGGPADSPAPLPDPPVPTIPLPDPLPDLPLTPFLPGSETQVSVD
jgi:hypothetical protein